MIRLSALCLVWLISCAAGVAAAAADTATTATAGLATATTGTGEHRALVPKPNKGRFMGLHRRYLERAKQGRIDVLFLGDSITERWTSFPKVWDKYYGDLRAANFGIGGDRTQHILWRIENGTLDGMSPKVLVLMIGTNNTNTDDAEPIAEAIRKIVREIRDRLPKTKILLLGIFPRAAKRDLPENIPNERVRAVNEEIAELGNGKDVRYLDIGEKFVVDGKVSPELMPDGVHLSRKGYEVWGEAIEPVLKEMLGKTKKTKKKKK